MEIQVKTCEGFQKFQWKDGGLLRLEDTPSESSAPDSSAAPWLELPHPVQRWAMVRDWITYRLLYSLRAPF
jgi:hypothetical protein